VRPKQMSYCRRGRADPRGEDGIFPLTIPALILVPRVTMSANDPKQTFPSPQLSGYTNIIPPARKTKSGTEMSKRCGGSTVSSLSCGEV
jgi:hypothetical protein